MAAPILCLHGHFYQPNRLNPQTGLIPDDDGAKSRSQGRWKNWNEVINDECYKPNALKQNFGRISFDFYRTLVNWIEDFDAETYQAIIAQTKQAEQRDGVSNMFAGPWDHVILPLLKFSDIETEIYWGITDFLHRFGFKPQGFWLPETAVNNVVLKELAANGVQLTILAPWQAKNPIDTNKLYFVPFDNNRQIACAFYHQDLSGNLSFNNAAMANADGFAEAILGPLKGQQFVLGATDGERYGHHLQFGDQFLERFLTVSAQQQGFEVMTLPKYFASHPATDAVEIAENSSWSCLHGGLQRWKGDCDCNVDYDRNKRIPGFWKSTLYQALMTLAEEVDVFYEAKMVPLVHDPALAKKLYIHVMLNEINAAEFLADHQKQPLSAEEERTVLGLLDMQRYKLTSFTSCGFFFADIDRPEPRINIHAAQKVISQIAELGYQDLSKKIEQPFLEALETIKSPFTNVSGKEVYFETVHGS